MTSHDQRREYRVGDRDALMAELDRWITHQKDMADTHPLWWEALYSATRQRVLEDFRAHVLSLAPAREETPINSDLRVRFMRAMYIADRSAIDNPLRAEQEAIDARRSWDEGREPPALRSLYGRWVDAVLAEMGLIQEERLEAFEAALEDFANLKWEEGQWFERLIWQGANRTPAGEARYDAICTQVKTDQAALIEATGLKSWKLE